MKLFNIIERATDFGTFRSRNHFFSFTLKIILYILPAVILGHSTDMAVEKMKKREALGENSLNYIIFQTMVNIITLYLFVLFLTDYTSEFQQTMSGGYFIVLYFGMQTNYIDMLKEYMNRMI
jgi:undecaprenyl pyrophosphate phosphatase UppP